MAKKPAASAPALSAELLALVQERDAILAWLKPAQDRELEIRKQLAASLCPEPMEGANRIFTADGYEVYIDHKINRKLDEAALDAVMPALDESYRVLGVLIQYKPALIMETYRSMPDDQRKLFQQALSETPGAPTLSIQKVEQPATPIMDAYEKAKNGSAGAASKSAAAPAGRTKTTAASITPTAGGDAHPSRVDKIKKAAAKAKAKATKGKK